MDDNILKTLEKLVGLRKSMTNFEPKNKSFNIREEEAGSAPVINLTFKTRTKYF